MKYYRVKFYKSETLHSSRDYDEIELRSAMYTVHFMTAQGFDCEINVYEKGDE